MTVDQRTDEAAIRDLFDRQTQAWAAGDAEAYAALFTDDADYVTWLGSHFKGRDAITSSHTPLFEKNLKGTRLDGEITQLRFLAFDVALVHSTGAVLKANGDVPDAIPRCRPWLPSGATVTGLSPRFRTQSTIG